MTEGQWYYKKYKMNCLCTKCGKPAAEDRTMCNECLEKHKARCKDYYHKNAQEINQRNSQKRAEEVKNAKTEHRCTICLNNKADKSYSTCWRCRADKNDWARGRYDNETEEHRKQRLEKSSARTKERRARLIEQGLCVCCGKRSADIGRQKCQFCTEKHNAARRQKAHRKGVIPHDMRGKGDYCKRCCNPVSNGEKYCPECAEKMVQSANRLNEYNKQQEHNAGYIYFQGLNKTDLQEKRTKHE